MNNPEISKLETLLDTTVEGLSKVTSKKMFGCHALWVNDNVFALVWKHGRIGFKIPTEAEYNSLMKTAGSDPWKAGSMQMAHWVLVPVAFHLKPTELKKWATKAHNLCMNLEKKPKKFSAAKARPLKKVASKTVKSKTKSKNP
jgi:TfoX/Sxy family transcriptional regulator of competence genes